MAIQWIHLPRIGYVEIFNNQIGAFLLSQLQVRVDIHERRWLHILQSGNVRALWSARVDGQKSHIWQIRHFLL